MDEEKLSEVFRDWWAREGYKHIAGGEPDNPPALVWYQRSPLEVMGHIEDERQFRLHEYYPPQYPW